MQVPEGGLIFIILFFIFMYAYPPIPKTAIEVSESGSIMGTFDMPDSLRQHRKASLLCYYRRLQPTFHHYIYYHSVFLVT